jgi:hypothetical protein
MKEGSKALRSATSTFIFSLYLSTLPTLGQTAIQWEQESSPNRDKLETNIPSWQPVPKDNPAGENNIQWNPLPSKDNLSAPDQIHWEAVDPSEEESKQQEADNSPSELAPKRAILPPKAKIFRSASRSITYGGMIYPEMGFWIPSVFRQDAQHIVTLTFQILGNPTNTGTPDRCDWSECADSQYLAELTPLITGPVSLGINYSQQESFLGSRSDGSWEQGGQALGFQIKGNLNNNIGLGVIGANLWNPYGKGGPNGRYPNPDEEVQADLGRAYLLLGSAAWDLGYWFNSEWPAILAVTAGAGNGRYKSIDDIAEQWINFGNLGPVATLGLAFNDRFSIFAEYAGQYAGFGMSVKPITDWPVTGTLMFRDFQGAYQGKVNCFQGNSGNCRTTVDARITVHF